MLIFFLSDEQCVKSKSVTNLAEATADPALDQPILNQIEVHPMVDGVMILEGGPPPQAPGILGAYPAAEMGFRIPGGGAAAAMGAVAQPGLHGAGLPVGAGAGLGNVVNFNPPGSPQLRPLINPNEPYPDQIPHDDN